MSYRVQNILSIAALVVIFIVSSLPLR